LPVFRVSEKAFLSKTIGTLYAGMVCALLQSVGQAVPAGFDCDDIAENTVHCHVGQDHQ